MTESQQTVSEPIGLDGYLHDQEHIRGGSSDDEECVGQVAMKSPHDLAETRSPSPGGNRRGSIPEAGLPSGKRAPPRPWPPTSASHQATSPSRPLVRRGSLKDKAWPPPGYTGPASSQTLPSPGGKGKKGPPRQWPPPRRASLLQDKNDNSTQDNSYTTDSQNNDSVIQSSKPEDKMEYEQAHNDIQVVQSSEPQVNMEHDQAHNGSYHDLEEDEDFATNKESHLLAPDSPQACRGTPLNMSPSPPATPEPRSDPSPSPRGSPRENSPDRYSPQRSASPIFQNQNDMS